ncbi:MAG: alpha/beta hydrolase-fold protein [Planctomycetota bacterium]|nr:alpha/beta hydrolase-fold protein [Planctomycetota bacterium]
MLKRFQGLRGRVQTVSFESDCLKGNPLGDPHWRDFAVYLPAGYDQGERRYPVLFDIVGFTGSGLSHVAWKNFTENVPERLDRLIDEAEMPPVIVVFPDCFTALGGNQYVNSAGVGDYADYLVKELVPFIDGQFRTMASRDHRGIFGKSSGGYGSLIHGMKHADTWGAIACHSGDAYFDYCYFTEWPRVLNVLAKHGRCPATFLENFHQMPKPSNNDVHVLMMLAMAATYDPAPETELGFHLPIDLLTGELNPERWAQWKRHDPVVLVDEYIESLKTLKLMYIDCGSRDQYHLQFGARILKNKLVAAGVAHHYEEFDDDHSAVDYRMDVSLPLLAKALS